MKDYEISLSVAIVCLIVGIVAFLSKHYVWGIIDLMLFILNLTCWKLNRPNYF